MDDETRAAFGRMDRYFELGYAEMRSLRSETRSIRTELEAVGVELKALRTDVNANSAELASLRDELRGFRDWVVTQFAELRAELKRFNVRLERLERR
ncbi:MAG TPA: hypothetical protein VMN60_11025 [Longimicrobiales bacterium]|nr:hypothetical protein [Longimicrobiales bacterium]